MKKRNALQKMRIRAGWTSARAFAEHMGIPKDTFTGYEQGKTDISLSLAWEFADELGCTIDELAGHDSPSSALSASELQLISDYRSTDDRGRRTIAATAAAQRGDAGLPSTIDEVAQ